MTRRRTRRYGDSPRPVRAGIERVMTHLRAPEPSIVEAVFAHWPDLVGDVIGAHARPVRIVDGTLVVEVDEPAWASELTWMADDLQAQLAKRLDTNEINKISVQLAR